MFVTSRDVTRARLFEFVVPFVQRDHGSVGRSRYPRKIRICDTMGYGVLIEGSDACSVAGLVYGLQHYSGVPSEMLEVTVTMVSIKLSPTLAAWLYGASAVNCSLLE